MYMYKDVKKSQSLAETFKPTLYVYAFFVCKLRDLSYICLSLFVPVGHPCRIMNRGGVKWM